jgi:hypothetical protein
VARGSVDISAKNKQAITMEFHNPKDSQTSAKLLMKLLSEEIARQIYNKKNNYEDLDTSDKKQEGRNLS